jgi:predicted nucleic acid-binding protein
VALVVLDASVIIGFLDPEDALHGACVRALADRQGDELAAPASVYAEILVGPCRSGAAAVSEVDAFLSDFAIRIEPVTAAVAQLGAQMRSKRPGLRLPDALVLAYGDTVDAESVLTGDGSWATLSRRVTVVRGR